MLGLCIDVNNCSFQSAEVHSYFEVQRRVGFADRLVLLHDAKVHLKNVTFLQSLFRNEVIFLT